MVNPNLSPGPEDAWATCANPQCRDLFPVAGWGQKYCGKRRCLRYRDQAASRKMRKRRSGRICKTCKRTDHEVTFAGNDECTSCKWRRAQGILCPDCRRVMTRRGKSRKVICLWCNPKDTERVYFHCQHRLRIVPRLNTSVISLGDRNTKVRAVKRKVGIVRVSVTPAGFATASLGAQSVLAVYGLSTPEFPRDLAFMPKKIVDSFYDLAHAIRLGRIPPLTKHRWAEICCPGQSYSTMDRAWLRFKTRLTKIGVEHRVVDHRSGEVEMDFERFALEVMKFVLRREGHAGDEDG